MKMMIMMTFPLIIQVVDNVQNYSNMKFQTKIITCSWENAKKPHFLTYFLIWLPSICENRHTVFRKVVDNDPRNISGKFEACIYSILRENEEKPIFFIRNCSFWPKNGWRWNFSSLVSIEKLYVMLRTIQICNFSQKFTRVLEKMRKNWFFL